ncbi:MAG: hypothetical protein NTX13_15300 [Acidobacteria bacterium]|nr:hypothetical protein [Acidobacteriota bacterium]
MAKSTHLGVCSCIGNWLEGGEPTRVNAEIKSAGSPLPAGMS